MIMRFNLFLPKMPVGKIFPTNFVFGSGDPRASLMLIGEAPGEYEDKKGEPFVGKSGDSLDKILEVININRENGVFISNVLLCRPPDNRNPLVSEIGKCEPTFLHKLIS